MGEKTVPVLYTDIDGTIRLGYDELGYFVNGADQVQVFPEVPDLLWAYKDLGWRIVGVSNQGGIALGHMTMDTCALAMLETNRQCRDAFDRLAWCSHHPNAETPEMARCWCRKPKAGMIIESALSMADQHPGELYKPYMGIFVGDMPSDEECAVNAGLEFIEAEAWRKGDHLRTVGKAVDTK